MKFKNGEIIRHKTIADQAMVIIKSYDDKSYDCRYYNIITGEFVTQYFYEYELEKVS